MNARESAARKAKSVAFCGIIAALGCLSMSMSAYVQILTYASPMMAALLLIPVRREFGTGTGWACWCATLLLTLLLCADKEAGFFYLFVGCYPVLKDRLDKLPAALRQPAKFLYFAASLAVLYAVIGYLLGFFDFRGELAESGLAFELVMIAMMLFTLMVYDKTVERMEILYDRVLRKKIRL